MRRSFHYWTLRRGTNAKVERADTGRHRSGRVATFRHATTAAYPNFAVIRRPFCSKLDSAREMTVPFAEYRRLFSSGSGSGDKTTDGGTPPQRIKASRERRRTFVPRKAPVLLTPKARNFFRSLLENAPEPDIIGIMLTYHQSSSGEPRMVYGFNFVTAAQLSPSDEGVSLEIMDDGTPKSPEESALDGLPKLYVNEHAFMKVLGATLDVDEEKVLPILYDREGNLMDPNA